MIRPFNVDQALSELRSPFPSAEQLHAALKDGERREREIFVRLWLSEGIPYAFRDYPSLFEEVRGWLGDRLDVHAKHITIIGSARIGYSLAKGAEYGRAFNPKSDLDFSVISSTLFERIVCDSSRFSEEYRGGEIQPRSDREHETWRENFRVFERNIPRGFLDSKMIPSKKRYVSAQAINNAMWLLVEKLRLTARAPTVQNASVRVYRDWTCFVDQVSLNIRRAIN